MECAFHTLNRRYIRMKKKDRKENTDILFSVLEELLKTMRSCDDLFNNLKPRLDFLGSYFDRIRVGQPTEYDINVILTFPINYDKIKLDATDCQHDYSAIIMPSEFRRLSSTPATANQGFTKTQLWCDKNYRLSVTKFRSWMQSTVDHAINNLPQKNGQRILKVKNKCFGIQSKTSGPANTITILKNDGSMIDVDLVPTFSFQLPRKPLNSQIDFSKVEATNIRSYFLVPKPGNDDFSWRVSFPFQERYLLQDKNNLKGAIRLLKHFRDVQGFTKLSSYFIKTLFLWECQSNDENFWKKKSLSYLVLTMLKKLKDCLEQNRIPNYWCSSHNLIEKTKTVTCQNWYHRISLILREIESVGHKNPHIILDYFTVKNNKLRKYVTNDF
ncbi:cyclic GMP-AMP synthase-like receptor isoform X1 [Maniola hyperantus]|uniref:cyclic GMP-AMP synthase-like receptor isoform X1 n=1 Tax=Aphantopus hyperantus TaxID=2795564 RepID=UPI0015688B18|nr:cyclic GMP-AMP synthase-like isoform X1 [Maniola hyperantus]XP_034823983.1 cyclic GMP-AMP synthase-like isoform X1 [Maniola hyperantus]XP_034823984.1 cyclic GMP-AMP synthase-like isoform X1 [Maniola hyperantus]XP_034823985.1 cyclic GMP-AMP synthase-like isoform X1 [Maniola hyperantus]